MMFVFRKLLGENPSSFFCVGLSWIFGQGSEAVRRLNGLILVVYILEFQVFSCFMNRSVIAKYSLLRDLLYVLIDSRKWGNSENDISNTTEKPRFGSCP